MRSRVWLALELAPRNVSVNTVSPGHHIKPTSITATEFASWPPGRCVEYCDPIDMVDTFAFLALQLTWEGGFTGLHFNAFAGGVDPPRRMGLAPPGHEQCRRYSVPSPESSYRKE